MTIMARARAALRALEQYAEALDADPLADLHRRVARLEQAIAAGAPVQAGGLTPDKGRPEAAAAPDPPAAL